MNEISKDIKNRIIIFYDGSRKNISEKEYQDFINANGDEIETDDGSRVKTSSFSKILTQEEYQREYPKEVEENRKERYYGPVEEQNKDKVFWDKHKNQSWLALSPEGKSKTKGSFVKLLFTLFGRSEVLKLKRMEIYSRIIDFYKTNPLRYYPDFEIFREDLQNERMSVVEDRALMAILKTIESDISDTLKREKYGNTPSDFWPQKAYELDYGTPIFNQKYSDYQ